MKFLSVLLLSSALLPVSSFAGNTANVNLSSASSAQTVQVTDQKFDPIYGTEEYQTTCSQQVLDHYENECSTVYDTVCQGGGQECHDVSDTVCNSSGCTPITRSECSQSQPDCTQVPRSECTQEPVYVNQDYPCTQTRQIITGYTLVKTFNHTIAVSVANAAILANQGLSVTVTANEDKVTATVSSPYTAALLTYSVSVTGNADNSATQNLSESVVIDLAAPAPDLNAFNADSNLALAIGSSALRISIPGAANLVNDLNFNIRIQKHRTLWFPTDLVNKTFDSATLGLVTQGNDIKTDIALSKLGITNSLDGSKFSVWVTVTLKTGNFLNASDFTTAIAKKLSDTLNSVKTSF